MGKNNNNFENQAKALVFTIDEILKQNNKSRYWLSQQTGINQGQLSKYFNGDNLPSLQVFLKMLHTVGINLFLEPKNAETELNKAFEEAMNRIDRRPNNISNEK